MEQDALKNLIEDEEEKQAYKHFMRMEPVKRIENEVHIDSDSGMRYEMRDIGMLRNDKNPKPMKVFLDPAPHIIVDSARELQEWYQNKLDPGHRPRPCMQSAILTSPYSGSCPVKCTSCYVNSGTRGYRSQNVTVVPRNYGEFVRKSLAKMKTSAAGYFSSFTEPFQELESIYHNTQEGAKAFVDVGLPIFFLSRKPYPGWAFDYILQNKYSYAQKSIHTSSPEDWRKLAPNAIPLLENFEEVRALHKAGIKVSIQVNPIISGVTSNENIVELIHILADCGADHLIFKHVEISYPSRKSLIEIMRAQFGERGKRFEELFTCNIGHQATIDEEYRINALDLFSRECKKAKVSMGTCYEFAYKRDSDHRIVDKVGVSLGLKYLTGPNCHGVKSPVHTRESIEQPWREVEECGPGGCLHCADDSPDKVTGACGSKFMGSAPAMTFKDLKTSVYNDTRPPFLGSNKKEDLVQILPTRKTLI